MTRLRGLLALVVGLVAGCGGDGEVPPPATPFGGGALAADVEPDTIVLVLLDGVRHGELAEHTAAGRLPAFGALRASSEDLGPMMAVTTAGNAAVATALTGQHPRDHGVQSLHHLGRASLDPRLPNAVVMLESLGWRTFGAFPSPRHARGLSGFERGFDHYGAPRVGEPARDAAGVVASLGPDFDAALAGAGRVFALVVFDDPIERGAPLARPGAVDVVARHMEPFAGGSGQVAAALELLRRDGAEGLAELERMFARARGGGEAKAWAAALDELRLAAVDEGLGALLGAVERAGRGPRTAVVLAGLRGRAERGVEAGPRLSAAAMEVPLWVRAPAPEGVNTERAPASGVDIPWLLLMMQGGSPRDPWEAIPWAGPTFPGLVGEALAATPDGSVHALRKGDLHVERYLDGEVVAFRGAERAPLEGEDMDLLLGALERFARPPELLVGGALPDGLALRWRAAEGSRVPIAGARRAPPTRGDLDDFEGDGEGVRRLPLTDRTTDLRLELRASAEGALAPGRVAFGQRTLHRLPVLYLPAEDAPPLADDPEGATPPRLTLTRADGLTWNLTVSGDGLPEGTRAEVLVTVWPPRHPSELLEVPASNVELTHVPGRRDLVHLAGALPFDVLLKRTGKESFAVACAVDGVFLTPDDMAADGDRYAGPAGYDLLVPAWQPGVSEVMVDLTGPLFTEAEGARGDGMDRARRSFPAGVLSIARRGFGPVPGPGAALPREALEYVRTLPPGE